MSKITDQINKRATENKKRMDNKKITLQDQVDQVRQWGVEKGIIGPKGKATLQTQFGKFLEEGNELDIAICNDDYDGITDGIGDTAVTLVMLSEIHGATFEDCLAWAYNEIKGRTGKMIDGTFVKD